MVGGWICGFSVDKFALLWGEAQLCLLIENQLEKLEAAKAA